MAAMAEFLATELRPKAVLVISNPFTQESGKPPEIYEFERASIAGLKRGFGESTKLVSGFPELRKEVIENPGAVRIDPTSKTPLSYLVADDAFQKVVEQNSECDLVISLIGLPFNMSAFPAWSKPGPPRFALLQPDWRMLGGGHAVLEAFRSGKLAAAVVRGGTQGEPFVLLTGANVEELMKSRPELFAP